MVLAHHLIWMGYGWWLPNDLRGSMSTYIASDIIAQLGELHFGRKKVQPLSREIRAFYDHAAHVLKFPLLNFSWREIEVIAQAFAQCIAINNYTCYACAILLDHVHLIIRKHKDLAETMIEKLQHASREAVIELGERNFDHPVWGGNGWKVFLDSPEDIWRTIPYVEENPLKLRMPEQKWLFVTPYDNWPFHKRWQQGP
jgi:REP element-mobilizing transposase RayT